MTKKEAVLLFGSTRNLADALGMTLHGVYMWPDELGQKNTDRVIGAALRTNRISCRTIKRFLPK